MATSQEQTDLVVNTVRNLSDLAEDVYRTANRYLEDLANGAVQLPFSLINVEIGSTAGISWNARDTVTFPTLPSIPEIGEPPDEITLDTPTDIEIVIPDQPSLEAPTVVAPGDITVGEVEFPITPTFPVFDESYLAIDTTPPANTVTIPAVGDVDITIPTQPVLAEPTVSLPGDITVATVDFPTTPTFPEFDDSYLAIDTTPPTNSVVLSDFGNVEITIPTQPTLADATVELPGDITVASVEFPDAPSYPLFDSSYLTFDLEAPVSTIVLSEVPDVDITIPNQPALADPVVELPQSITVATVEFPDAPTFPLFDSSYLDIAVERPVSEVVLSDFTTIPITIPDQPVLAEGTVSIPGDITVADVAFPSEPTFPSFDESYLAIATEPPLNEVSLSDFGEVPITIPAQPVLADATVELPGDITVASVDFPTAPIFPTFDDSYLDFSIDEPLLAGSLADVDFTYLEPTYTSQIMSDVTAAISRVLGGEMGLPASYWTSIWEQAANDLARQQTARTRQARNRGAASFWALPSETVLGSSREILDETARSVQINRLEQAKLAAEHARQDLWKAVETGLSAEQILVGAFQQMAGRALAAAQTLFNMKVEKNKQLIELYNSEIAKYAAISRGKSDIAQAYTTGFNSQVQGLASIFKAEIDGALGEIELEKAKIEAWIAKWQGYKTESDVRLGELTAEAGMWSTAIENKVKVETAIQAKDDREIELYKAEISAYSAETQGKAAIADAYATAYGKQVDALSQRFKSSVDGALGEIELEKAKLDAWIAKWKGYETESNVRLGALTAETNVWTSAVENKVKVEQAVQTKDDREIKLYEAEIEAYKAESQGKAAIADAYTSAYGKQVDALSQQYKSGIEGALGEIELEKAKLDAWSTQWQGYKVDSDTRIGELEAKTRLWTSSVENTIRLEELKQKKGDQEISKYGVDVNAYSAEVQGRSQIAQAYTAGYASQTSALAQQFKSQIDGALGEIELEKAKIDAWIAKWQGYKTEGDVRINTLEAQTRLWTAAVENTVKVESAKQQKDDREIELYKADIAAYDAETRGKATVAQAYSSAYASQTDSLAQQFKSEVEGALGRIDLEKAKIDAWVAQWQGYKTEGDVRLGELNAKTQLWNAAVDNTVKVESLKQNTGSQEIELYKAEVDAYDAETRGKATIAQAYSSSYGNQVSALAQQFKAEIDGAIGEIELEKSKLEAWIAKWKGFEIDANTRIGTLEAKTKLWTSAVENTVNVEQVQQQFNKNNIDYYTAQMGRIEAMSRVVAALAGAHVSKASAETQYAGLGVDLDKAKNDVETRLTALTQAAQEAGAKLEIEQSQWIQGQAIGIQQRLAELAFGYAQAAVAAAGVNLSSGVGMNFSDSSDRNYSWDMNEQGNYVPPGI